VWINSLTSTGVVPPLATEFACLILHRIWQLGIESSQGGLDPAHLVVGQLEPMAEQAGEKIKPDFAWGRKMNVLLTQTACALLMNLAIVLLMVYYLNGIPQVT